MKKKNKKKFKIGQIYGLNKFNKILNLRKKVWLKEFRKYLVKKYKNQTDLSRGLNKNIVQSKLKLFQKTVTRLKRILKNLSYKKIFNRLKKDHYLSFMKILGKIKKFCFQKMISFLFKNKP